MQGSAKLVKYYIFFAVLLVATAGAVVYTLSKANDSKVDNLTSSKVVEIGSKLNTYISNKNQIPVTLDDAGVNNVPAAISYTKINDTQFKFCVSYKTAGASSGAGSLPGIVYSVLRSGTPNIPQDNSFLDLYTFAIAYKAGQTCQTVSPSGLTVAADVSALKQAQAAATKATASASPNSSNLIAAKCGSNGASFELKDETTVTSVDTGQGIITLNTTSAKLTDKNSSPVSSLASIKYDSLTSAYATAGCKKLAQKDIDALKPGASITVYLFSHDSTYADQLEL